MMNEMQQPPVTDIQESPGYVDTALHNLEEAGILINESKPGELEQRGTTETGTEKDEIPSEIDLTTIPTSINTEPIDFSQLTFEVTRFPTGNGEICIHFESDTDTSYDTGTSFDIFIFREGYRIEGKISGDRFGSSFNGFNFQPGTDMRISVHEVVENKGTRNEYIRHSIQILFYNEDRYRNGTRDPGYDPIDVVNIQKLPNNLLISASSDQRGGRLTTIELELNDD